METNSDGQEGGGGGAKGSIPPRTTPTDTVAMIKLKIEEAKAAQDHKRAQKLREHLWKFKDTGVLEPGVLDVVPSTADSTEPRLLSSVSSSSSSSRHSMESATASNISDSNPAAKSLHKLEKKLKAIQELKEKKSKGVKLEANQRAKIGTEDEVKKEIEMLREILSKDNSNKQS